MKHKELFHLANARSMLKYLTFFIVFLTVLGIALLHPTITASGDSGLGIGIFWDFSFKYPGQPIPIVEGQMLECIDAACYSSETIICGGFGSFGCDKDRCRAKMSGPDCRQFHKLVITFSDKTRESNIFSKSWLGDYIVTVNDDRLHIDEVVLSTITVEKVNDFFTASLLTLVIEIAISALFAKALKLDAEMLAALVFLANIITLPIVWFIFPSFGMNITAMTFFSELFAVVFEAFFLFISFRKGGFSIGNLIVLSLSMNAASFLAGLFIANYAPL